jgi:O-antigen/teichoic acid export membrane protein
VRNIKINQIKAGAILSYVQMLLSTVIGLVYTPFMLKMLGQNEYGLYNTALSTISALSVLNLGFTSGYIRYYAKYKKAKNEDGIAKLNGMFLLIFMIIGLIALCGGFTLTLNIDKVFSNGLNASEYNTAYVLMLLMTVNLSLSFPMSVFSNIVSSNERYLFLRVTAIARTIINPLISVSLLLVGFRSIALVVVMLILSVASDLLNLFYVIFVLKQKFHFRNFEKGLFVDLLVFTSFIAINLVVDQINGNIDNVLLARFKGTAEVAIYSVGYALYHYYIMFSKSVSSVFIPRVHRIINDNADDVKMQRELITTLFIKVGRIQFIILALVASGFLFFGKYFIMHYWAGSTYETSYYVTLLLMIAAFVALIQNIGIEVQRALNRHKFRSIVYLGMALCNLGISIVLCQKYGALGSTIGTVVSLLLANGLIMNIYYHKKCNMDIIAFWKCIFQLSKGLLLPVVIGVVIMNFVSYTSIWSYLLTIIGYTIVYLVSMWFFGMNEYEKELIKKTLRKFVRR